MGNDPAKPSGVTVPSLLDHLVYATPRLEDTLDRLEASFGVRPMAGGTHPAWRTRNAIVPLSRDTYLEIIGPEFSGPGGLPEIFGLAALEAPRLVTWAAKGTQLEGLVERAGRHGVRLGLTGAGSRLGPDGTRLSWELTDPFQPRAGGLLPFFIDWGASPHPGSIAAAVVGLVDFHAEHPDPVSLERQLTALGLDLRTEPGRRPRLVATFTTPRGIVTLS